jgi:hypothetical protein
MNKLLLEFDQGDDIIGIEHIHIFHNEKDLIECLNSIPAICSYILNLEMKYLSFETTGGWKGRARICWVKSYL